jgi:cold shock protein
VFSGGLAEGRNAVFVLANTTLLQLGARGVPLKRWKINFILAVFRFLEKNKDEGCLQWYLYYLNGVKCCNISLPDTTYLEVCNGCNNYAWALKPGFFHLMLIALIEAAPRLGCSPTQEGQPSRWYSEKQETNAGLCSFAAAPTIFVHTALQIFPPAGIKIKMLQSVVKAYICTSLINNTMQKNLGTVKFFNAEKGFGFIKHDDSNKETFVHVSGLVSEIKEGDKVEFEMQEGRKGMNAINVKLV